MAGAYIVGSLVELSGLPGDLGLNNQKAQLVRYDDVAEKWVAATFDGCLVSVGSQYIRQLDIEDVAGYDFIFGPQSDVDTIAAELSETLSNKGYAVVKLFIAQEDTDEMLTVASQLEEAGQFSRLAVEFESGYLGRDGSGKTVMLDPSADSTPSYVRESPLRTVDQNFGAFTQMLAPYFEDSLGFNVHSRTAMMMRMPLEEEDEDRYQPAEFDDADAEGYMHTMIRKQMELLQFVGPAEGSLTLVPRTGVGRMLGEEIQIKAEPNTMVLVVNSRFDFALDYAAGKSLTLSSFLLSEPATYTLEQISGDARTLGLMGGGPAGPAGEHITVEGMYCRYGTGADGRHQLWSGFNAGTDGITDIPLTRYDHGPYWDPDGNKGGSYTRHGCFGIEGVDLFDCRFFEISPAESKGMDPCQRQVMEVSYMALLEGGYDKRMLQKTPQNIGHFVGIDKDDWLIMISTGAVDTSGFVGAAAAANAITANRFSYSLNLKGASMQIDTACSSSLVCTHVSKLHLRYKGNEKMPASVVNGLNLMLSPGPFVSCAQAGMLSHEGRCFTFNSSADGYARGELCGALCFKSQQYDPHTSSLCVLAGTASNQDGRSASMTAPNGPAQEKCIQSCLKESGLTPSQIDCFECHGTGTSLGDPIEVGSFKKVMSATARENPIAITSSKSNIAHAEGGAGLAGFFKCCLQVQHCEAMSNCHLRSRNPHLDLEGFPCQIMTESLTMRDDAAYCGVSSFGFGGTNAHGEAWGKNIMTSRGTTLQDPSVLFQKKLQAAPAAEISMKGSDVNNWETTGLDPRAEPDSRWQIELDEDGVALWEKADEELDDIGTEFSIMGTFNNWQQHELRPHDSIEGCWVGEVKLGPKGEEEFQIVSDGEADRIISPNQPRTAMKAAMILGPREADRTNTWLVQGAPGETWTVEFFSQGRVMTVLWYKA